MSEENIIDENTITLEFEDGDLDCECLGVMDFEDKEYMVLLPLDDSEDVYIYEYVELGEEEFELLDIEDDALFERLVEELEKVFAEDEE